MLLYVSWRIENRDIEQFIQIFSGIFRDIKQHFAMFWHIQEY